MGAFSPLPPMDDGQQGPGGTFSPALAEQNPGALGAVTPDRVSGDIAALTQAAELIMGVGGQHTNDPLVPEKIRAAVAAINEVIAAVQAAAQVGMRDERSPVL